MKKNLTLSLAMMLTVAAMTSVCMAQAANKTPADNKPKFENAVEPAANTPAPANNNAAQPNPNQPAANNNNAPLMQNPGACGLMSSEGGNMGLFVLLFGVLIVVWIFSRNAQKKQEKKFKDMLANMKKGDKVVTIGGIIGTAVEVRDDEVLVKVDENTRMKFARWAIRSIGEDAKKQAEQQQAEKK